MYKHLLFDLTTFLLYFHTKLVDFHNLASLIYTPIEHKASRMNLPKKFAYKTQYPSKHSRRV